MGYYANQNKTALAKVETTAGVDASPVVATDAYAPESPVMRPDIQTIDTNEVTGSLDPKPSVAGGAKGNYTCSINIKGSGTAGVKPDWGTLLRGCGMAQTLTASPVTGTAQAGAASTITLAAGASAVNDFYKGMVITITSGTGSGQTRVIHGYAGSTKIASIMPNWTTNPDGTSAYSVLANALYIPRSSGIESLTLYDYLHNSDAAVNSKLRKLIGAQGDASFTLPTAGIPKIDFNFQGKFVAPADVSKPAAPTLDATRPAAFMSAQCYLDSQATKISQTTFGLGNQIEVDDDPSDTFGSDIAAILRRKITGRINPPVALNSVRDAIADFLAGTTRKLWLQYGSVAGNRISILMPQILYTGSEPEDNRGFAHEGIPFSAGGEDSGVYICIY